jgi:hypothetical protein
VGRDRLGIAHQRHQSESEKRAVAEIHDGFDTGRDEDRRRPLHFGGTLLEFHRSYAEALTFADRPIGIGKQ